MAAARQAADRADASGLVDQLGSGLEEVINAAQVAAKAQRPPATAVSTATPASLGRVFASDPEAHVAVASVMVLASPVGRPCPGSTANACCIWSTVNPQPGIAHCRVDCGM